MQTKSKTLKELRPTSIRSGVTRYAVSLAVNAVTVFEGKPYFFLFCDIDCQDKELLRQALAVYRRKNLTVYFWQTAKGWNLASPCLLHIRKWTKYKAILQKLNEGYSFDSIRVSKRYTDGKTLFYEQWNRKLYYESYDLISLLADRFSVSFTKRCVHTNLDISIYRQLRLLKTL